MRNSRQRLVPPILVTNPAPMTHLCKAGLLVLEHEHPKCLSILKQNSASFAKKINSLTQEFKLYRKGVLHEVRL